MTNHDKALEAERAVLGSILLQTESWDRIDLERGEFFSRVNREIFDAIAALIDEHQPVDVVTVSDRLRNVPDAIAVVAQLAQDTPSAANVVGYAKIVREEHHRRAIIALCHDTMAELEAGQSPARLIDEIQTRAAETVTGDGQGLRPVREGLSVHMEILDQRLQGKRKGLMTGLADLDDMLAGLHGSDLIVIAGRPGMGKSTLAQTIARTVANCAPVAVFNAEMSEEQQNDRLLAAESSVPLSRIRVGQELEDSEWTRLSGATASLMRLPIRFDYRSAPTLAHVQRQCRTMKRQCGLGLVVVDYLQLMAMPDAERRDLQIGLLSAGLKALAKDLRVPVIALSQLNRSLEQRPDKRPRMSDLRDSGAIEQDADVILFAYRDEVYHEDTPEPGIMEINIAKQRQGEIGTVRTAWQGAYSRVANLPSGWAPEEREDKPKGRRFASRYDKPAGNVIPVDY